MCSSNGNESKCLSDASLESRCVKIRLLAVTSLLWPGLVMAWLAIKRNNLVQQFYHWKYCRTWMNNNDNFIVACLYLFLCPTLFHSLVPMFTMCTISLTISLSKYSGWLHSSNTLIILIVSCNLQVTFIQGRFLPFNNDKLMFCHATLCKQLFFVSSDVGCPSPKDPPLYSY